MPQRQALSFPVYCSVKHSELCSLFSRLPARFSWCIWIRSKMKRAGTSSAAALLIQHSLLTWLTLGNSLTFLTVTILATVLCKNSEACLFQDATVKTGLWKHVWKQRMMCHQAELLTIHVSKGAVRAARRQWCSSCLWWFNITTWTPHVAIALVKGSRNFIQR